MSIEVETHATGGYAAFVEAVRAAQPTAALVLGSGMGGVADRLSDKFTIPFLDVPDLCVTSVPGHRGCLTLGRWAGQWVLAFEGRLHFYEGHPWRSVVLPVQAAAFLGAKVVVLTNAAGGIRDDLTPGSFMAIRDHIEWTQPYCWRLPGPGGLGPSRPSPYSPRLLDILEQASQRTNIPVAQGVYAAVTGPNYETPAEIRALKAWGADAVGMSTTREATAAVQAGMECLGLSLITNRAAGLSRSPIQHEEVQSAAAGRTEQLAELLQCLLEYL